MSSINLDRYQARHPNEREAILRLAQLLAAGGARRFTFDQLASELDANSDDELALVLGELAGAGLVGFEYQVQSPRTNQPIAKFKSLGDIPKTIHDRTTDSEIVVHMDDVRPIYSLPGHPRV